MDKLLLEKIMLENQKEVEEHEVQPRNISFDGFDRYVLVGIRRAGKSYLLYQQMQKLLAEGHDWSEMLYLNFEDERLEGFTTMDFNIIRDEDTRRRYVKALTALPKVLPCKRRCIITYDETDEWQLSDVGIEVLPVWTWLL